MLTSGEDKLFEGTWALLQGDDSRRLEQLPRIVLRDSVAWYVSAPQAVGYYEIEGDRIVIGLPTGPDGLDLITARLVTTGDRHELTGVVDALTGDGESMCDPCILLRASISTTTRAAEPALAAS